MTLDVSPERAKLWGLIKDIRFGMLTTRHADGYLQSRPMTTQNSRLDENGTLWLFMSCLSDSAIDLRACPSVCMSYADTSADSYVSVSGDAHVSDDEAMKRELWTLPAKAWFPGGVGDPDLLLVRLDVQRADYWDVTESKIVQLWRLASAVFSGEPPVDLGERGHLQKR
jgi:general stress protein 26